jgi:hypothetical protein
LDVLVERRRAYLVPGVTNRGPILALAQPLNPGCGRASRGIVPLATWVVVGSPLVVTVRRLTVMGVEFIEELTRYTLTRSRTPYAPTVKVCPTGVLFK